MKLQLERSLSVGIDKNDIIAITVSKVETDLIGKQAENDTKITAIKKNITQLGKTLEQTIEARFDKKHGPDLDKASKALKALGLDVTPSINVHICNDHVCVDINMVRQYGFNRSYNAEFTTAEAKAIDKIDIETDRLKRYQSYGVELRKRLSQISTLERQARASLAIASLKKSGDTEILKGISGICGLPKLPAPPK